MRSDILDTDHFLRLDVPDLQSQAADNIPRMERSGFGLSQFRYGLQDFRQAIKRNACVQVMNVMITDIGREPAPNWTGFQEAGRFKRGLFISPARAVIKRNSRKVMLR